MRNEISSIILLNKFFDLEYGRRTYNILYMWKNEVQFFSYYFPMTQSCEGLIVVLKNKVKKLGLLFFRCEESCNKWVIYDIVHCLKGS